jgi:RNA recognition motif-containing protein
MLELEVVRIETTKNLMNIYVGNLSYDVTEDGLQNLFAEYGQVTSVKIITDRDTGRSKGFGFVEMADDGEGQTAIEKLNEVDFGGRALTVNQARPKAPGGGGGGGPRRGGGGGGGGGGRGRY